MYLTYNTLDWTWCHTSATNSLTASILERKDCLNKQTANFERLLKQTKSWKQRDKYRILITELAGAQKELDGLHGHIITVHHDNTVDTADGDIKGTVYGTVEKSLSYGGTV